MLNKIAEEFFRHAEKGGMQGLIKGVGITIDRDFGYLGLVLDDDRWTGFKEEIREGILSRGLGFVYLGFPMVYAHFDMTMPRRSIESLHTFINSVTRAEWHVDNRMLESEDIEILRKFEDLFYDKRVSSSLWSDVVMRPILFINRDGSVSLRMISAITPRIESMVKGKHGYMRGEYYTVERDYLIGSVSDPFDELHYATIDIEADNLNELYVRTTEVLERVVGVELPYYMRDMPRTLREEIMDTERLMSELGIFTGGVRLMAEGEKWVATAVIDKRRLSAHAYEVLKYSLLAKLKSGVISELNLEGDKIMVGVAAPRMEDAVFKLRNGVIRYYGEEMPHIFRVSNAVEKVKDIGVLSSLKDMGWKVEYINDARVVCRNTIGKRDIVLDITPALVRVGINENGKVARFNIVPADLAVRYRDGEGSTILGISILNGYDSLVLEAEYRELPDGSKAIVKESYTHTYTYPENTMGELEAPYYEVKYPMPEVERAAERGVSL